MAEELRAEPIQYNGQVQNTAIGPDRAQSNDDPILCIYETSQDWKEAINLY